MVYCYWLTCSTIRWDTPACSFNRRFIRAFKRCAIETIVVDTGPRSPPLLLVANVVNEAPRKYLIKNIAGPIVSSLVSSHLMLSFSVLIQAETHTQNEPHTYKYIAVRNLCYFSERQTIQRYNMISLRIDSRMTEVTCGVGNFVLLVVSVELTFGKIYECVHLRGSSRMCVVAFVLTRWWKSFVKIQQDRVKDEADPLRIHIAVRSGSGCGRELIVRACILLEFNMCSLPRYNGWTRINACQPAQWHCARNRLKSIRNNIRCKETGPGPNKNWRSIREECARVRTTVSKTEFVYF